MATPSSPPQRSPVDTVNVRNVMDGELSPTTLDSNHVSGTSSTTRTSLGLLSTVESEILSHRSKGRGANKNMVPSVSDLSLDRNWLPNFTNNLTNNSIKYFLLTEEKHDLHTDTLMGGTKTVPVATGLRIPKNAGQYGFADLDVNLVLNKDEIKDNEKAISRMQKTILIKGWRLIAKNLGIPNLGSKSKQAVRYAIARAKIQGESFDRDAATCKKQGFRQDPCQFHSNCQYHCPSRSVDQISWTKRSSWKDRA
mmetsp:Transcript_13495/g.37286  ORF Transcript_13495/g.37286 Transcript_13495/m.37286 type:complete len:253 (+) Transcript_13495:323-1081(+)